MVLSWPIAAVLHSGGECKNRTTNHFSDTQELARAGRPRTDKFRSRLANQMRLVLRTAAYWLVGTIQTAVLPGEPLAAAEFSAIRLRLLKVAVRVRETTNRIRLALATICPNARPFRHLIGLRRA
jgi:hypothetical protein